MSTRLSGLRCNAFWVVLPGLLAISESRSVRAETQATATTAALAFAEEAYQRVDFEKVYEEALRGLKLGNANVKTTARFHVLIGISAAALDKGDDAREHFIAALAVAPSLHLERNLSPKLRGPYLEACGFWDAYQERLGLTASVDAAGKQLLLSLEDPAHLAHAIRLYFRKAGSVAFTSSNIDVHGTLRLSLPLELLREGFEYFGQVVDEHGNEIYALADATKVVTVAGKPTGASPSVSNPVARGSRTPRNSKTTSWFPQALAMGGLAAVGVGAVFNYRREKLAGEWNSPKCEQPGQTRLGQCAGINSERKTAERVSIGLYAGGGLAVVGGIVLWLTEQSPKEGQPKTKGDTYSTACGVDTRNGLGASCAGSF